MYVYPASMLRISPESIVLSMQTDCECYQNLLLRAIVYTTQCVYTVERIYKDPSVRDTFSIYKCVCVYIYMSNTNRLFLK